jgi:hypothetical protein
MSSVESKKEHSTSEKSQTSDNKQLKIKWGLRWKIQLLLILWLAYFLKFLSVSQWSRNFLFRFSNIFQVEICRFRFTYSHTSFTQKMVKSEVSQRRTENIVMSEGWKTRLWNVNEKVEKDSSWFWELRKNVGKKTMRMSRKVRTDDFSFLC